MRNKKLQAENIFDVQRKHQSLKGHEIRKRSPIKKVSPKGKRKLSFPSQKPGLLSGKKFFLDLQGTGKASAVKDIIEKLGGTLEEFNSKEVYCIITNRFTVDEIIQHKNQNRRGTPSPLPGPVPSPLFVPVPSPLQQISSNKGAVNSPLSTDSPQTPQSLEHKGLNITRGKSLLSKAVSSTQKQGSSHLLQLAKKWGTKVLHLEQFLKWSKEKKVAECIQACSKNVSSHSYSSSHGKHSTFKVKKLKSPFLKVEDKTRKFRPYFIELEEWPAIHFESPSGSCPFEKPKERNTFVETNEQISDKETNKDDSSQAISEDGSARQQEKQAVGKPQPKEGKVDSKFGYCECCSVRFNDLTKHLKSDQHRTFARNDSNYAELDAIIQRGKTFEEFLASVHEKYNENASGKNDIFEKKTSVEEKECNSSKINIQNDLHKTDECSQERQESHENAKEKIKKQHLENDSAQISGQNPCDTLKIIDETQDAALIGETQPADCIEDVVAKNLQNLGKTDMNRVKEIAEIKTKIDMPDLCCNGVYLQSGVNISFNHARINCKETENSEEKINDDDLNQSLHVWELKDNNGEKVEDVSNKSLKEMDESEEARIEEIFEKSKVVKSDVKVHFGRKMCDHYDCDLESKEVGNQGESPEDLDGNIGYAIPQYAPGDISIKDKSSAYCTQAVNEKGPDLREITRDNETNFKQRNRSKKGKFSLETSENLNVKRTSPRLRKTRGNRRHRSDSGKKVNEGSVERRLQTRSSCELSSLFSREINNAAVETSSEIKDKGKSGLSKVDPLLLSHFSSKTPRNSGLLEQKSKGSNRTTSELNKGKKDKGYVAKIVSKENVSPDEPKCTDVFAKSSQKFNSIEMLDNCKINQSSKQIFASQKQDSRTHEHKREGCDTLNSSSSSSTETCLSPPTVEEQRPSCQKDESFAGSSTSEYEENGTSLNATFGDSSVCEIDSPIDRKSECSKVPAVRDAHAKKEDVPTSLIAKDAKSDRVDVETPNGNYCSEVEAVKCNAENEISILSTSVVPSFWTSSGSATPYKFVPEKSVKNYEKGSNIQDVQSNVLDYAEEFFDKCLKTSEPSEEKTCLDRSTKWCDSSTTVPIDKNDSLDAKIVQVNAQHTVESQSFDDPDNDIHNTCKANHATNKPFSTGRDMSALGRPSGNYILSPLGRNKGNSMINDETPNNANFYSSPTSDNNFKNQVEDILTGLRLSAEKRIDCNLAGEAKCKKSLAKSLNKRSAPNKKGSRGDGSEALESYSVFNDGNGDSAVFMDEMVKDNPFRGDKNSQEDLDCNVHFSKKKKRRKTNLSSPPSSEELAAPTHDGDGHKNEDRSLVLKSHSEAASFNITKERPIRKLLECNPSNSDCGLADDVSMFLDEDFKKGISMHERLKARKRAASCAASFQIGMLKKPNRSTTPCPKKSLRESLHIRKTKNDFQQKDIRKKDKKDSAHNELFIDEDSEITRIKGHIKRGRSVCETTSPLREIIKNPKYGRSPSTPQTKVGHLPRTARRINNANSSSDEDFEPSSSSSLCETDMAMSSSPPARTLRPRSRDTSYQPPGNTPFSLKLTNSSVFESPDAGIDSTPLSNSALPFQRSVLRSTPLVGTKNEDQRKTFSRRRGRKNSVKNLDEDVFAYKDDPCDL